MGKFAIVFALDFLRNSSVVRLQFVNDISPIAKQSIAHFRPKTTKLIFLHANMALPTVKNPQDCYFEVNTYNINMLQF